MKTILTVTLNPALDEIVHVDDRRKGCRQIQIFPGGKGVNVTRALKALGMSSTALVAVSGASGSTLVRGLKREHLSFMAFGLSYGETRVNRTAIEDRTGRVTRTMAAGPRWSVKDQRGFRRMFSKALERTSLLVLSGRLPPGVPSKFYSILIREAFAQGVPVFLDTSGAALRSGLRARPTGVKPNREEAESVLAARLSSRRAVRNALQSFLDYGMKMVLLTLGERGLAVAQGGRFCFVKAPRAKRGHAVGCGDAALAGFLAGWHRGQDLVACARSAAACGAANLLGDVPGGITKSAVKRIAARIKVEEL
jgi:1-phosphofructokinase family hexose kinase